MREFYNINCRGVDKSNQLCNSYRYNHQEKKWWKKLFEEIYQISLANLYIIYTYGAQRTQIKLLNRKEFHLEIIRYLISEEKVEKPLKFTHYSDWVPLKAEFLKSKDISRNYTKKDFRLNCKNKNCTKKTDLYCPGCSSKDFICTLCVPECFIEYHKKSF